MSKFLSKYKALSVQVKAGIWFFACSMIQKGIGFLTTPLFTRLMSTEQYGIYTIYQTWRDLLSILITFGLSSSVYMKKMIDLDSQEEKNKLTCSLQGLATLTTAIGLLIYLLFRPTWNRITKLPTEAMLAIFVSVLLTTAYDFWAARARINYKYRALVAITLLTALLKPAIALLAMSHTTETAYARIYSITFIEILLFSYFYYINFKPREKWFNSKYWKYAILFVLPLIPHYLSQRILSSSDRIMIDEMVGKSEAGIYGLANSIGSILSVVVTSCDSVLAPWVYANIKENKTEQINRISSYIVSMMAILSMGVIVLVPELTKFFAPSEYYDAIWTLPPLVISVYFMMVYLFFIYYEYYYEQTKQIMIATMTSAALNLALNFIFIKRFGYIAAGYTTLFCYISYSVFHYFVYKDICKKQGYEKLPYNTRIIAIISLFLIVFGLGAMCLYPHPRIRYLIILIFFTAAFIMKKRILLVFKQIKG